MRRLGAIGVCAVLLLALGGAAAPAWAAPTVTVAPWCDESNYGIEVTLAGFPPDSSVGASITSDVYNLGPIFYQADATGRVDPITLGSSAPLGLVTITAFADLDGDQAPGPGEPVATGTAEQPCGQRPLPGGSVTGSAAGNLDDGTPAAFSFAAHSGAQGVDPGGSVSETRDGQTFAGTVTCVAVRRVTATVGVSFPGGGPDGTPAEVLRVSNEPDPFRSVVVSAVPQAPGPDECPLPGSPGEGRSLSSPTEWSIAVGGAISDTTPPTLHGADSRVVDATTAGGPTSATAACTRRTTSIRRPMCPARRQRARSCRSGRPPSRAPPPTPPATTRRRPSRSACSAPAGSSSSRRRSWPASVCPTGRRSRCW